MAGDVAAQADRVWHRALGLEPASRLPGDVAAYAVLEFHGMVMNGGVLHAVEGRGEEYVSSAEDAYRWLGLAGVADLIGEVRRTLADRRSTTPATIDELEVESDTRYDSLVPEDSDLEAALGRRIVDSPESFS